MANKQKRLWFAIVSAYDNLSRRDGNFVVMADSLHTARRDGVAEVNKNIGRDLPIGRFNIAW